MTEQTDVLGRTTAVLAGASRAGGALLGVGVRGLAALRPAQKPLHPSGRVRRGTLRRLGSTVPTGVAFLDLAGQDAVLVRESRAAGLPRGLPDVHGLAIRVPAPDGTVGDLLLSSTGWGRLSRFVLLPGRGTWTRPMTTLLPYRTPVGRLLIGARERGPGTLELAFAVDTGPWHRFAFLGISDEDADDPTISFDPVENQIPGLQQFPALARLREPAYRSARRSRAAG